MTFHPHLAKLQPYPFEKLKQLFADLTPNPAYSPISLGLGEPKHPTPELIKQALRDHLGGLASYPSTAGSEALRSAISQWLARRYAIPALDPATQILPVNGSREALFALAQTIVNTEQAGNTAPLVLCPNPFYQIYEGAAYLAGAEPYFANADPQRNFAPDYSSIPEHIWQRVQLLFICSPGNPTGAVLKLNDWKELFALSDRYGFVIAADECYSEIYFKAEAPLGSLEAARLLGRDDYRRLITLSSLSKRSNVPGMRSGFVAGDAEIIKNFLLYRTYHGSAMSPVIQAASVAAWNDETHVIENREKYIQKFAQITPLLQDVLEVNLPDAAFYLWAKVDGLGGISDTEFARRLYQQYHVTVLPGSYLAREAHGINPGSKRIRMALVADTAECLEAAQRIVAFCKGLTSE
ncbi:MULTISPECIES: succinyldiaminopimelate transaminase [unclassified Undibacterium]|uniref:succinyldiaminopimelate transaminase n=1 Tax=unclassified Undibacterium TaxID=2630295 RepID=UPI002AC9660A|nr:MULTISPECIES: succinyldiaminopimelate transaminase [unclassified Undibacterium]MEB0138558.1 succinyldiaminopimelate transaminase [Undibacterium sp. CCC2.1]MEB0171378.1 succinyldiaminopimelate transaminase [Undibacterium sp. CCC1.1]MEB0175322.1 succinyldiaminopimelate transaminase [Undibacterium sp. CCC3.4]MEB0214574.1 succinyldiaminopimelate transaminase [Undibacterium sp. 5I2]WPX43051.1 succinyldiaminopimelate transaminase [Undibacterium sp. CCC3.4]